MVRAEDDLDSAETKLDRPIRPSTFDRAVVTEDTKKRGGRREPRSTAADILLRSHSMGKRRRGEADTRPATSPAKHPGAVPFVAA